MNERTIINLVARVHDKAQRFLMRELAARNITGIAPSHGDILGALIICSELQMKDLAKLIGKDKSTVTALVNKLIDLKYVVKNTADDDNRVSLVSLSRKGRALVPDIKEISDKLLKTTYRGFSKAERSTLINLLTKVHNNF